MKNFLMFISKIIVIIFIFFYTKFAFAWTFEELDALYMHCGYNEVSIHKRLNENEGETFCKCTVDLFSKYFRSMEEIMELSKSEKKFHKDKRIIKIDKTCNKKIGKISAIQSCA